ncbi:hypothetical protein L6R53_05710 [Myxococcota bacterium]|nr:hypothetical protein [Myxococcota bacterium]
MLLPLTLALLAGCGPAASISEEEARAVLEPALAAATPAGRTGLLLKGKAVWLQAPYFDKSCLEQKDLAFNDNPGARPSGGGGVARISPTYKNQRYLTASTQTGYCVLLGDGLKAEIKEATFDWGTQDRWRFKVAYTMATPSPWFECLDPGLKEREIVVRQGEGDGPPVIEGSVLLAEGDCPHPMPGGEERTPGKVASKAAPKAPTRDQVVAAMKAYDDALWEGDFQAALAALSCTNLFEDQKVGTCSVGEVIAAGPVPRGEPRMQDGTPWLEYVQDDYTAFERIVPDRKDKTMAHALFKHKRSGKERSVSVQYVDGAWKLVGVVGKQAESITTARVVNDLHDSKRRDIYDRRLAGEQIDEEGNSLVPEEPPAEE